MMRIEIQQMCDVGQSLFLQRWNEVLFIQGIFRQRSDGKGAQQ